MYRFYWILLALGLAACQSPSSQNALEQNSHLQVLSVGSAELGSTPIGQRDLEFEMLCAHWRLSAQQVEQFFARAQEGALELAQERRTPPCSIRGELLENGEAWEYSLNAAGYATLKQGDKQRYFACQQEACLQSLLLD